MEYETVHVLNLECQCDRGISTCSFDVDNSLTELVEVVKGTNPVTLAQLPLLASDIGRPGMECERHTRLVAHLAVALVFTKGDRIDLNFGLPEDQASPQSSSQQTKLVNTQLRRYLDAWLAALVEAAGNSVAEHVDVSSYVLQAATRYEYNKVLGHKRLVFQQVPFRQAPHVVLCVNTDMCELTGDLVWRALRNIKCLDLQFEVERAQQRLMLQKLPGDGLHCLSVSGCDVHAPGMFKALISALWRIKELESLQLGPVSEMVGDVAENPLTKRQMDCLANCLRRPWRIVSMEFSNKTLMDEMFERMHWPMSYYKYTAEQIKIAVGEAAWGAAREEMGRVGGVDEAIHLLKEVVDLAANECSSPLAPAIVKLMRLQPPPAA